MFGQESLRDLIPIILVAVFILWDFVKHQLLSKDTDLKENTKALIIATHEIKTINEKLVSLSRLPKDVQNLSTKIRVIETKLEN